MHLCGINHNNNNPESEAEAIHRMAADIQQDVAAYDNADIAGTLEYIVQQATDIFASVQADACFDINHLPIDRAIVAEEFNTLSTDLETIANTIHTFAATERGLIRWPEDPVDVHGTPISIAHNITQINQLSEDFARFFNPGLK